MGKDQKRDIEKKCLDNSTKLKIFNLFDNLSGDELDLISRQALVLNFEKGEVVCEEDTGSDSMFFIHDGDVSISRNGVSFASLESGDYFGQ